MQQINYLTELSEFQGFYVRGVERRKNLGCVMRLFYTWKGMEGISVVDVTRRSIVNIAPITSKASNKVLAEGKVLIYKK